MRDINQIVIHCSVTPPSMDIGADEIRQWHLDRGWSDIGYHYVIRRSGEVEVGRPVQKAGAHVRGHNHDSIGVCLVGGKDMVDYTHRQWNSLVDLVDDLVDRYDCKVLGHRDLTTEKPCPWFDVKSWWGE